MAQVLPAKRPHGFSHRSQASVDSLAPRSKRTRVSHEPSIESSEAEEDLDNSLAVSLPVQNEDDDAARFERVTQLVYQDYQRQGDNKAAECGIIEEIACTNFMCHEQLTVRLGPLINFIIGHNGSGKSAVLTALTLCLGGKANATNRGQNLKSFIKQGKDWSVLSVKIKNQGIGAFKADQFGDSIIVERHFTLNGTSGFKLKDRNGKIVSTRKSELEDIIDHFGLQIDNPMNVLTQDMARQFLNDSTARDKYKFFLKGTQLENLDRDYSQIEQELEEQNAKHQTLAKDVEELRARYGRLEKKAQSARGLEKMRAEEMKIERQAIWSFVDGCETEIATCEGNISEVSNTIQERKREADTASDDFARLDQQVNDATAAIEECQANLQPARDEEAEAKIQFKEATTKLLELKNNERNIFGTIQRTKNIMQSTQSQIEEQKERRALADGGLHEQKVRELEEAKTLYAQRKSEWENSDQDLPALNQELQDAKGLLRRSKALVNDKEHEEKQLGAKLRNLERGQGNWYDAYPNGSNLEKLVRAIEQEHRWNHPPAGPIGRYLELKHPRWSSVLESSFGGVLNSFVVTNKVDQSRLSDLMRRYNHAAQVFICAKADRLDTTGNTPDSDLLTIDSALNINNDLVRNSLILNQTIEQIVLIEKRAEASDLAHQDPSRRPNVKAIYCWSDVSHRLGHQFTMNNTTRSTSISAIREFVGSGRMQADKSHRIQEAKDHLLAVQGEVQDARLKAEAAQQELNRAQAEIRNQQSTRKDLEKEMDRARENVDRLDGEVAAAVPDTAQLEQLEKELDDYQEQLHLDEEQAEDLKGEMRNASMNSKEHKHKVDAAAAAVKALEDKLEQCKVQAHTQKQKREQALRRKNQAIEKVEEAEEALVSFQQTLGELNTELEEHVTTARGYCERVDVPRGATWEDLQRKLKEAQKRRAELENELGGSSEQLVSRANAAKKAWAEAQIFVGNSEALRNSLTRALVERRIRWKHFRDSISLRAHVTFIYLLSERRFSGKLLVDHDRKALDMNIQPDSSVGSQAARQTKTLSGGEKSFSTICLLLALWDAMGSPIRCLDEFDVFMDSVNRDISMSMIIGAARRATGRQYILITPQAMNNKKVRTMADVTVIKMTDPERGQTALNLGG